MAADIDVGIHRRGSSTPSVPVPVPCGNGPQGRFANMTVPVGRGSPPGSAPAGILKLSRSADNLAALGAVSGTPPPAGSYTSRNSFMAVSGKQDAELLKSVQRKLVGDASLFFDILSEGAPAVFACVIQAWVPTCVHQSSDASVISCLIQVRR